MGYQINFSAERCHMLQLLHCTWATVSSLNWTDIFIHVPTCLWSYGIVLPFSPICYESFCNGFIISGYIIHSCTHIFTASYTAAVSYVTHTVTFPLKAYLGLICPSSGLWIPSESLSQAGTSNIVLFMGRDLDQSHNFRGGAIIPCSLPIYTTPSQSKMPLKATISHKVGGGTL